MGNNFVKNSRMEILKPHAHLHIIERKSTTYQVNPMKDVGDVAETRSLGWTAGVRSHERIHKWLEIRIFDI